MRLLALAALLVPAFAAERPIDFNRDVRPILSDKCYHCHATDAPAKRIRLRLDSEAGAKADLGGKRAIVDGQPEASELLRRVTHDKKAMRMPPPSSGLSLTPGEIDTLRSWIAQGAKWQAHWSFLPPQRPELPPVRNASWSRNPVDRFVLDRLEREGLSPSPEARPEALLRRASLDLTGLPPTLFELDALQKDRSPGAYERAVDRLLASPRYGERMAARWLDAARYADTNGYQFDGPRDMWRWRDWVIASFNRNQPFDQFVREQIAGDLLPGSTLDQKIATGFNRNHRANTEDGIVPEEYAVEYVVDRVETASTVFLGLTLGCARCHNHKYDPFTQKEFYQLFAYFNNVPEQGRAMKYGNSPPMVPAPTPDQQRVLAALDARIAAQEGVLRRRESALTRGQAAWEQALAGQPPTHWFPTRNLDRALPLNDLNGATAAGGIAQVVPGRVGKALALDGKVALEAGNTGDFDIEDRFTLSAWLYADETPQGALVSRMDDKATGKGYGVYLNQGRVHVHLTSVYADDAIRLDTVSALSPKAWHHVAVTYTGSRMAEGVRVYVDGTLQEVKVELDTLYRPFRNAGAQFRHPFRIGGGGGPERRFRGSIDEVRVYGRVLDTDELASLAAGEPLQSAAATAPARRSPTDRYRLRLAYQETGAPAAARAEWQRLEELRAERDTLQRTFPTVMVMAELPTTRETFLLQRGAYNVPGERVTPGVPAALPPFPAGAPNNRLGLAQWLTAPDHPLLARVTVNRFWQMLFGTGLVKTTEDFGLQGEWPSHPELLDWLATEFVRTGWDSKALLRTIVTSATYRQASTARPDLLQRDPENRLLARGSRFRLPAEMVRDQALAASNILVEKVGGPSVKPYQPAGLWKEMSMQDTDYVQGKGEDLHRRSLYTYWKRAVAPPMLANFDSAMRESCVVRETRTNTPLQALNLMNDVTFLEAARFLGQRMLTEGGATPESRLRHGFRLATGRVPGTEEMAVLRGSLAYHLDHFASDPARPGAYLRQGEAPTDSRLAPRDLAAYAAVASLLLNLDEVVTKE